jgi:hypothetical protein
MFMFRSNMSRPGISPEQRANHGNNYGDTGDGHKSAGTGSRFRRYVPLGYLVGPATRPAALISGPS